MKSFLILGIALIILGAAALGYGSFSYTTQEKVLEIGSIKAMADQTKSVTIPPILGWALLASGAVVLIFGVTRKNG